MILVSKIGNRKVVSHSSSFPLSSTLLFLLSSSLSFLLSSHLLFSASNLLSYSLPCYGVGPLNTSSLAISLHFFSISILLSYSLRCYAVSPPFLEVSSSAILKVSKVVAINPFFLDEEDLVISIFWGFFRYLPFSSLYLDIKKTKFYSVFLYFF